MFKKKKKQELTAYAQSCLDENLSIVATDSETGQILGEKI